MPPKLKLEARSSADCGWYDCEVLVKGKPPQLLVRFDGYGTSDDEAIESLDRLRFSSMPCEDKHCTLLAPGTRVTAFKRSDECDVWVDAVVRSKQQGGHAAGKKCDCRFSVEYLDSEAKGRQEALLLEDLCLLDRRPLTAHPKFPEYRLVLGAPAGANGAGSSAGAKGAGGSERGSAGAKGAGGSGRDSAAVPSGDAGGGGAEVAAEQQRVPDTPPSSGPAAAGPSGKAQQEAQQQQQEAQQAHQEPQQQPQQPHELQPPSWANGEECMLCRLRTIPPRRDADGGADGSSEERSPFEGVQLGESGWVHRSCAIWSCLPPLRHVGLNSATHVKRVKMELSGALNEAMGSACPVCKLVGATVQCSHGSCRKRFHLHCTLQCKHDWEAQKLLCPAHAVLGGVKAVPVTTFFPAAQGGGGKAQPGGLGGTSITALKTMQSIRSTSRKGMLALQPVAGQKGGQGAASGKKGSSQRLGSLYAQGKRGAPRRSERQAGSSKRVRYAEGAVPGEDEGSEYEGDEEEEEEELSGEAVLLLDESGEEDDFEESGPGRGRGRRCAGRGAAQQRPKSQRKSERSRKQVKTYDESRAEAELYEEAVKEAARQEKTGYEDTYCQVCESKARAKEMLLCDGCDHGWHMGCLTPPLTHQPLASWFCPGCIQHQECEACGKSGGAGRSKKGGSAADASLDYCTGCGAVCHPGCMQSQKAGGLQCSFCVAGLSSIDSILGCRQQHGRREYYVKFKDACYRRCQWVREATALRMNPDRVNRFERDTRGAANVEPNVQPQWLEVERVISVQPAPSGGGERCLVKWRGLGYECATWEKREEVEAGAVKQYERRMALRVERSEEREQAIRRRPPPRVPAAGPAYLEGIGSLKNYQVTGIEWLLSKLHARLSVILGDEMGLGKTIQTAVFLQLAREAGLTTGPVMVVVPLSTIGSWERELAKWAPGLEVLAYNGSQEARAIIRRYELGTEDDSMETARQKLTKVLPRFHCMLTTYEVADKDAAILRRFGWSGCIIDEGHRLKGENSKLGAQLRSLGAPWRLLLTGTPLQNNLRELFALLAFMADCTIDAVERKIKAMPDPNPPPPPSARRLPPSQTGMDGALLSPSPLGHHGATPEADPEILEAQAYVRKLHAYLEPRMLRRLKHTTLLGELPAKITRRVACRLSPMQRQLYADILAKNYDAVNATAHNRAQRKSMNNILMRLRQVCNHPYQFAGQEPEGLRAEEAQRLLAAVSGKLSVLQQMLPRLLAGGHRVLIFSQSTQLLDILEDFLHGFIDTTGLLPTPDELPVSASEDSEEGGEEGEQSGSGSDEEGEGRRRGAVIPFYRIDGSTKLQERQAMIDSFNSGHSKVRVFLMSTRAGSLGINLQTADTVILYDPDFNPFVDAQAEGRAHRLGQQKTVMVYQMFTAHTVEERILSLAAKKRKLEAVVTKHLGREKEVSNEDIKSSLFYGWGNLMASADEDGRGDDVALSEAALASLLDRSRVHEGDLVIGADAGSLLGEVKEGNAAAMTFEQAEAEGKEDDDAVVDRAAEERMLRLLEERSRKFRREQELAAQEMGRGRRTQGRLQSYLEDSGDELDEDETPARAGQRREREEGKSGAGRKRRKADSDGDADYDPLLSPFMANTRALHAGAPSGDQNSQPNRHPGEGGPPAVNLLQAEVYSSSGSSDSDSDDSDASGRRAKRRRRALAAAEGGTQPQARLQQTIEAAAAAVAAAVAAAAAGRAKAEAGPPPGAPRVTAGGGAAAAGIATAPGETKVAGAGLTADERAQLQRMMVQHQQQLQRVMGGHASQRPAAPAAAPPPARQQQQGQRQASSDSSDSSDSSSSDDSDDSTSS